MPGRRDQLVKHRRVRRRLVGDHLNGCRLRYADGLLEEPPGGLRVATRRYEHVDDLPEVVDCLVDVAPHRSVRQ
jgi:hypothetical protein